MCFNTQAQRYDYQNQLLICVFFQPVLPLKGFFSENSHLLEFNKNIFRS